MSSRFVISEGGVSLTLLEEAPWGASKLRFAFRLGWRCACYLPTGLIDSAEEFSRSPQNSSIWMARGRAVNVFVQCGPKAKLGTGMGLIADFWVEGSRSTSDEIKEARDALEIVCSELNALLNLSSNYSWHLKIRQEFFEVKLPNSLAYRLDTVRAKAALKSKFNASSPYDQSLPTLQLHGNRLQTGPEPPGVIDALWRYLKEEMGDTATTVSLKSTPFRYMSYIPIIMAAMLVATWLLPLKAWSVTLAGATFVILMGMALFPAHYIGWRTLFRQTFAVATFGFFGIAVFGVAYAVRAIVSDELGPVTKLGYPFLVSTSLGIAGGIIGDSPKGIAQIIAHIQLLLFLSGLLSVVAVLLKINRNVRQRGESG